MLALGLALAALPAAAQAKKKRSLNWRYKKAPVERKTPPAADAKKAAAKPAGLAAPAWTPQVRRALDEFLVAKGSMSASYDPKSPPVAVLSWSDAAIKGDPAELVFLRLVTDVRFKIDEDWWQLVPIGYGRQPARTGYSQFISLSTTVWRSQPGYHAWRKAMLSSYIDLCRGVGRRECRSYLARLWTGWRPYDAEDYARAALEDEKDQAASSELIPGELGDPSPLKVRRGLREIPEMRELTERLLAAGVDVWVVDDVPQPVLLASTADYGIDPSRAIGIRSAAQGPRYDTTVALPIPTRGGKAEAVQSTLGRPADLVVGRDIADFDLLVHAEGGLRVVLDGDPELVRRASENGWLIQPSFAR